MKFYTNFFMRGNYVVVRGYDHGSRFTDRIEYKPTLYVPAKTMTDYQAIDGQFLEPIRFGAIRDARDFVNNYSDVDGFSIFGSTLYDYVCVHENYTQDYDTEFVKVVNIDIEVASDDGFPDPVAATKPITAITASIGGAYYTFGCGDYTNTNENVTYLKCDNEKHLLHNFIAHWRHWDADIVTGWNVQFFDIPYLYNRITRVLSEKDAKKLSPVGMTNERDVQIMNRTHREVELIGMSTLDYLELYKKFTYSQQESYRLDHIASVELGERKLDYSEVETLHQLYKLDYQKFIDYNIKDVELVNRLEDKMKLIDMALAIAYDAKVNYNDVFTQVRMWDVLIHNWLYERKKIIPPKVAKSKNAQYAGAYVKDPQVGMHDWVMSFDLNSLYPHLIMQYNISPDTFVEEEYEDITVDEILDGRVVHRDGLVMAANGRFFDRSKQGFLPEMMQKMYNDRVIAKKKMLEAQALLEEVNRRLK